MFPNFSKFAVFLPVYPSSHSFPVEIDYNYT
jgi:hypothetical protein